MQKDHKISLEINAELIGYIAESEKSLSMHELPRYSQLLEKKAENKLTKFLKDLHSEGVDPIGFGLNYRAQTMHHKRMRSEEWKEAYQNAEVKVKVTASLKSTGSIQ